MPNQIFYSQTFPCLVRNRETILFQGDAFALSTVNNKGKLDVIPGHTHFVSIIEQSLKIVKTDGKTVEFPVNKGILKVFDNEVKVFLGIFSSVSKAETKTDTNE